MDGSPTIARPTADERKALERRPVEPVPPSQQSVFATFVRTHDGSATLAAVQSLSLIIVIAVFIVTFSLQPFRIPSASMEPTLLVGDFLLVAKQPPTSADALDPFPGSAIQRGDVIVFFYPIDPSLHLVKRVIGLPGDHLRMRNGRVFINGRALVEHYAFYGPGHGDPFRDNFPYLQSTDPDVDSRWWTALHRLVDRDELVIPAGHYFVLGDNRNNSEDSRYWGLVPTASIVGKPLLVYFSLRDPSEDGRLSHDIEREASHEPGQRRSLIEAIIDVARWDRTLRIIR